MSKIDRYHIDKLSGLDCEVCLSEDVEKLELSYSEMSNCLNSYEHNIEILETKCKKLSIDEVQQMFENLYKDSEAVDLSKRYNRKYRYNDPRIDSEWDGYQQALEDVGML